MDNEGHQGTFCPYVVPALPVNLWGRDVMANTGVYLYSPNSTVTNQLLSQGLLPNQGLGIQNQGSLQPLSPQKLPPYAGLGYF